VTSKAFTGKVFLAVGDGASPEVFTRYCEMTTLSGLGQTNAQIEVTTFCSGGNKEYIPGLADGSVITIEGNYDPLNTVQNSLIADVKAKANRHFEVQIDEDSPATVFHFTGSMLSWDMTPSLSAANKITFTSKISGDITINTTP
jgi:hypothetical protein